MCLNSSYNLVGGLCVNSTEYSEHCSSYKYISASGKFICSECDFGYAVQYNSTTKLYTCILAESVI